MTVQEFSDKWEDGIDGINPETELEFSVDPNQTEKVKIELMDGKVHCVLGQGGGFRDSNGNKI